METVYLRWPLRDGFIAQGLQGLHGSVVSGCLAGAALPDELMAPHRQLHEEDLGNGIVVPAVRRETGVFFLSQICRKECAEVDGGL